MELKEIIRDLMKTRNLNQKDLAKKAEITEASLSKYLSGERTPRIDVIVKLSNALAVSMDTIMGCKETKCDFIDARVALARCKDKLTEDEKKKLIQFLLED